VGWNPIIKRRGLNPIIKRGLESHYQEGGWNSINYISSEKSTISITNCSSYI
jgi:hypothetical protein